MPVNRSAGLFAFDRALGKTLVAGADEAGRGCLAGPLVAAAVMLDYSAPGFSHEIALDGLDDSKKKTRSARERLYSLIVGTAKTVTIVFRSPNTIDERGLHRTNIEALADCLAGVAEAGCVLLSDGFHLPELEGDHRAVVGGDGKSAAIAAASIVAKVTRDRFMRSVDRSYPEWGFASHVGYPTAAHRSAIATHGTTVLHRRSFRSAAYSGVGKTPAPPKRPRSIQDRFEC